jgi:energy-coupling factor transporter ATP-binding protein EcfA2
MSTHAAPIRTHACTTHASRRTCTASASTSRSVRAFASASDASDRWGVDVDQLWVEFTRGAASQPIQALKGASLRVPKGTLFMLLGPNGCGKSTLLRVLAGLVVPKSGDARTSARKAFVFQNPDHQVIMPTVGADVAFGLGRNQSLSDNDIRTRVEEALTLVNLTEPDAYERQVATLSGGQKQRVAIAGALVEKPELLLLDELTTFLDEEDQRGVIEAVRHAVDSSAGAVTAIWVTHRLEELEYADGAAYVEDGYVVKVGTGSQIREFIRQKQDAYVIGERY